MQSIKNGAENFQVDQYPKIFYYLTFLNLGDLKNIIFNEKNNIEIVRAGTIQRIKSELTKEGIIVKIKCIKYVANDMNQFVAYSLIAIIF